MVNSQLYPNNPSYTNNDYAFTDSISNLLLQYPEDFSDGYWTGWVSWENLTNYAHVSHCTITGNAGLSFEDITPEQNANIGYLVNYPTSIQDINNHKALLPISNHSGYYGVGNNSTSPLVNDNFDFSFINKLNIQKVNPLSEAISIKFGAWTGTNVAYNSWEGEYNMACSVETFLHFLYGEAPLHLNDSGLVVDLDINDLNSNNMWEHSFSGVTGYIALIYVRWLPYNYNYNNNQNRIYPFTYVDTPNGRFYTTFSWGGFPYLSYRIGSGFSSTPCAYDVLNGEFYFRGKYQGSITEQEVNTLVFKGSKIDGTCIFIKLNNEILIYNIIDPKDLIKMFTLHLRMCSNNNHLTDSFSDYIYYPLVNERNEYLCEWVHGNFEDIKDQLRTWQYTDIDKNTYNPATKANNFYFGENQIQSLYYGENEIQALYYGPYLIFPTTPPTPPNPYTEISYIEATGTQYINTGYTQQSNSLRIKMTVRPAFMGNTGKIIAAPNFGLKVVWYGTIQGRFYGIDFYVNDSALFSGGTWLDPQSYFTEVEAILNPTTAQLLQDSGTSGSGAGSDASISASSPYCIFSEAGQELLQCQLSACQIYDNEVLVRDFIPVLRNSDNKPGLLDRVNNQFYTNAGTGEFIYYE